MNSSYAFQVYEPCDQSDFLAASATYTRVGYNHPQGLKFAINVDVAMSEIYLSNATGRGLNEVVAAVGVAGAARLTSLDVGGSSRAGFDFGAGGGGQGEAGTLLLYTYADVASDGGARVLYATVNGSKPTAAAATTTPAAATKQRQQLEAAAILRPLPGWSGGSAPPTSLTSIATPGGNSSSSSSNGGDGGGGGGGGGIVVAAVKDAAGTLYLHNGKAGGQLTPLQNISLKLPAGSHELATVLVNQDGGHETGAVVQLLQLFSTLNGTAGCKLSQQLWSFSDGLDRPPLPAGDSICLVQNGTLTVVSAGVVATTTTTVVLYEAADATLHVVTASSSPSLSSSSSDARVELVINGGYGAVAGTAVGVGVGPTMSSVQHGSTSSLSSGGSRIAVATFGDAFCTFFFV